MKRIMFLGALLVAVMGSGCASLLSKSEYPVNISTDASNATITVKKLNSQQLIAKGSSPMVVKLNAGDGFFTSASYLCEVTAPGRKKQYQLINAQIDPWFFGNFFLGGIIGVAVDGATGAMFKLPENILVCDQN